MPGTALGAGDTEVLKAGFLALLVIRGGRPASQGVPSQGVYTELQAQESRRGCIGKGTFGHVFHGRLGVLRDWEGRWEYGIYVEKEKAFQAEGLATPGGGVRKPYLSRTQWSLELQLTLAGNRTRKEAARQRRSFRNWVYG